MSTKWNYFEKITVSETSFPTNPQTTFEFHGQGVVFYNEGGVDVEYSLDGVNIHGIVPATTKLQFNYRNVNKIWFQTASGSPVIRVEGWADTEATQKGDFFNDVEINSNIFPESPQVVFGFITRGFKLKNTGASIIEYSFDGSNLGGTLNPADNTIERFFEDRMATKIWFRSPVSSGTVETEGWGNSRIQ